MIGTWVNFFAIIIGSIIGLVLHRGISQKMSETLMKGLGLIIILIGIKGALEVDNWPILIISMAVGALIGEWIDIEAKLESFGLYVEAKFAKKSKGTFAQGFIMASLMFGVGAMAIVGALKNGLNNDPTMLYTKSLLDFISSIILSSTLGIGVMFSAFVILVYQGGITLFSIFIQPWLNLYPMMIVDIGIVGSVVIIGLGLKMMKISDIKVANLIPAIFMPILLHVLLSLI
jgi:uncharacterized membrane protein YqgA involved in biofilm formation